MKPHKWPPRGGRPCGFVPTVGFPVLNSLLPLLLLPVGADSATNFVTSLDDGGSFGSLRTLVTLAQPGDTIQFSVNGTIILAAGELDLNKDLSLLGAGPETLAISGRGSNRVFIIRSGARVVISGITVEDGRSADGADGRQNPDLTTTAGLPGEPGGGILNAGTLFLQNCVVTNNVTGKGGKGVSVWPPYMGNPSAGGAGGAGGGIHNSGSLTLSNCTIAGNTCGNGGVSGSSTWAPMSGPGGCGGGIYNAGILVLAHSSVSGNRAGDGDHTPISGPGPDGGSGGGVCSKSNFLAFRTVFSGNYAGHGGGGVSGGRGGDGGGVWDGGTMALVGSVFSNNITGAGGYGGGTYYGGGSGGGGGAGGAVLTGDGVLTGCTVYNNGTSYGGDGGSSASGSAGGGGSGGAGAGIRSLGHARLTNCTVNANVCGGGGRGGGSSGSGGVGGSGGGISFGGSNQVLVACTIAGNITGVAGEGAGYPGTPGYGGGIAGGRSSALNSIIALNLRAGGEKQDANGAFYSLGYNLVGVTNGSSGFAAPGDLTGSTNAAVDPKLDALEFNGGPTPTVALLRGSPAIDSGAASGIPLFDQRGLARPQGIRPDMGAYEVASPVPRFVDAVYTNLNTFVARIVGMPNQNWLLETSSNLVTWTGGTSVVLDEHGACGLVDASLGNDGARFYRLRSQ